MTTALTKATEAKGLGLENYVHSLINAALETDDPWALSEARLAKYDATGEYLAAEPVLEALKARVAEGVARSRRNA